LAIATQGYICISATFTKAISGIITMVGALSSVFIPAAADGGVNQGGIAIGIDLGVD
jgi:hypothetical protein